MDRAADADDDPRQGPRAPARRRCSQPVEIDDEDRALAERLIAERSARGYRRRAGPRAPRRDAAARGADRATRPRRVAPRSTSAHRPGFEDIVWFRMDIGRRQNADPRWILPLICRRGHVTRTRSARSASAAAKPISRCRARSPPSSAMRSRAPPGPKARMRCGSSRRRAGPMPARAAIMDRPRYVAAHRARAARPSAAVRLRVAALRRAAARLRAMVRARPTPSAAPPPEASVDRQAVADPGLVDQQARSAGSASSLRRSPRIATRR